jgi:adenylate cyclase
MINGEVTMPMQLGVLVIDDEEGIRRSITRLLKSEGYFVQAAKDGEEALQTVRNNPHNLDIVICDLMMPGIDGITTMEEINGLHPEVTRIILTGYGTLDASIKAIEAGVDGFITKPFENRDLTWKIKECYLKRKLKQFVAPDIFREVLNKPVPLEPKVSRITILFSDIRGFTRLCTEMPPEELATLLNRDYFHPLSAIIMKHNGMVDKYIGDSIMALFGTPVDQGKHEEKAVQCAIEMLGAPGLARGGLDVGIGIATGIAITGVFGSTSKKEYTAMGTPVNIAARLQKLAGPGEIIISEITREALNGDMMFEHCGDLSFLPSSAPVAYFKWLRDG